jgi:hypothetical protein
MLKKGTLLVILALAVPLAAFADSVDFTNSSGTLTGSASGLQATSTLIAVNGVYGGGLITGNDLGTVSFQTGSLLWGSIANGALFAGGGHFTVTGNGTNGVPDGTIFDGVFSQPVQWAKLLLPDGTYDYSLIGILDGVLSGFENTSGVSFQVTVNTGKSPFDGTTSIASGDTVVVHVPEPSTMSMAGVLLITLAGAGWRKAVAQPVGLSA